MSGKFIYTNDEKTKDKLVEANFKLFKKTSNGYWVFFNRADLVFEKIDNVFITNTVVF